jgi:hypothetical protein
MATFVVCSKCGRVQEIGEADQLPEGWQRSLASLFCLHCTDTDVLSVEAAGDVLAEEVIYPPAPAPEDTLDEIEGFCEICSGPCQGH